MSNQFHTALTDNSSTLDSAGLDQPMGQLDGVILKTNYRTFATAEGPILFNSTAVKYPLMYVFFQRESDGAWVRNTISPAGSRTLTASASTALATIVTLNEVNDTNIASTMQEVDYDSLTASPAIKGKEYFPLWVRTPQATGTGVIHFVGLKAVQYIAGSDNLATGTTRVVNFPTGITLPDTTYKVFLQEAGATTTLNWYTTLGPRVTAKTATNFTITVSVAAASETFDWMIIP